MRLVERVYARLREAIAAFVEDDAHSHGAAIAFYALTALVPIMYIVVAIVGGLYGRDAARGAMSHDMQRLIGPYVARMLSHTLQNAAYTNRGFLADVLNAAFLIAVASGAFGEVQTALNRIWRSTPPPRTWGYIVRTRLESLVLVFVLALLMLASMILTAVLTAADAESVVHALPAPALVLQASNFVVMWILSGTLFAAIYRVLPDTQLSWRDVGIGGIITGLLFQCGQIAIGYYLGSSSTVSIYGAAGSLMALLLWIYYAAEIFLFGAVLTKVLTKHRRAG